MKIHILGRNTLNCALYLEFNVYFANDKKTTLMNKLPIFSYTTINI